jgi:hypothetical protein
MGALASLRIHHKDRIAAERLVRRAVAEVRRFERILGLYREDSAGVRMLLAHLEGGSKIEAQRRSWAGCSRAKNTSSRKVASLCPAAFGSPRGSRAAVGATALLAYWLFLAP